jgi:hypothetical protein
MTMKDVVLKYPTWQEPYRAAVIETNPKLLKHKIAAAEQAPYCDSSNYKTAQTIITN